MAARRSSPQPAAPRFHDPGTYIRNYQDEFLVKCPRCEGCARITSRKHESQAQDEITEHGQAWRMVCGQCGHFARWAGRAPWGSQTSDRESGCGLPLWLRTTCHGRPVWVYNERHLNDLTAFIAATHRGRGVRPEGGPSSRTMIASLPSWLISAKNRADVSRALARLRDKLPDPSPRKSSAGTGAEKSPAR